MLFLSTSLLSLPLLLVPSIVSLPRRFQQQVTSILFFIPRAQFNFIPSSIIPLIVFNFSLFSHDAIILLLSRSTFATFDDYDF
jgi:hypothetical protein